jgi:hypothetical protein
MKHDHKSSQLTFSGSHITFPELVYFNKTYKHDLIMGEINSVNAAPLLNA